MKNFHKQHPLVLEGQEYINAQRVIDKLHKIPRTDWVDRGVINPETVGEHTEDLVALAEKIFDIPGLSIMLKIHDWAETDSEVGDIRTDSLCPDSHRWTKEEKYQAELKAINKICSTLEFSGASILKLWLEYEKQETNRAKIARQLDKFQAITKAIEYQTQGQPVNAREFIDYDGGKITHPLLRRMLNESINKLKQNI